MGFGWLNLVGDVNITNGTYRINGVPITAGGGSQTPWTGPIDGAGFNLSNAGKVSIGTANEIGALTVASAIIGFPNGIVSAAYTSLGDFQGAASLYLIKHRGTPSAPAAVQPG